MRWLAVASLALASLCAHASERVITIPTRDGVTEGYLLLATDDAPKKVVVVTFVGGQGLIRLARRAEHPPLVFGKDTNSLVRIRNLLVNADIADAIVDSPSDRQQAGMDDTFRAGADHARDIRAVIADVQKRYPDARFYLVGTSRGTISAANLGVSLHDIVAGTIMSSTVTHWDKMGIALSQFDFAALKVPTLLIHHVDDGCFTSPYAGASALANRFPLVSARGGDAPQSGPCDPLAPHGFYGLDAQVATVMQQFMLGQPYSHTIP